MEKRFKKILIINLGGIGDMLLSTPALRGIKSSFPESQISMLVVERAYDVVRVLPYIDKPVIFYIGAKGFIKNLKTLLDLRKDSYDLAINMRTLVSWWGSQKIRLLLAVINPRLKAGRNTSARGSFFDISIEESDMGDKYEMEYDIEIAKAIGADVIDKKIDLFVNSLEAYKINQILEQEGLAKSDTLVGIHPGGEVFRRWPIEKFAEVINELDKKTEVKFIISGSADENTLAEHLKEITNAKIVNLCGRLNFQELAALIKRCSVYICNDTGPMHIAAILNVPLVAIFGGGSLKRYNPSNISDRATVLDSHVECAPCNNKKCRVLKCLKDVSSVSVIQAVLDLINKRD